MATAKAIPLHAKLMFKGKIFDTYQWEQQMYDGSFVTFERLKRSCTAAVIPIVGDKILITEQEQPDTHLFISLPGGRCDENEDPLVAAQRELLEETGYVSDDWILWKEDRPFNKIVWTIYTYIARNCKLKQSPHLDAGEKIKLKLVTFAEFIMLSEDPQFRDVGLATELLRIRLHPEKLQKFQNLLFYE